MVKRLIFLLCLLPLRPCAQFLAWDFHDISTDILEAAAYPDMAIDASGGIHISCWNEEEDRLQYIYRANGAATWTREYVDISRANGFRSAIALDATGKPHVVYQENLNGYVQIRYAKRAAAGTWNIEVIPGDSTWGWGEYGSNGILTTTHRLKNSVDILIDENSQPQVVFFNAWMDDGALNPCNSNSIYDLRLTQAFRASANNWIVRGFGLVPDVRSSCGANTSSYAMPTGDRYGEFCNLVQRKDNSMQTFCLSRYNNRVLNFRTNLPNTDTIWTRGETDSLGRMQPGFLWADRFFTIEGISAHVDDSDVVHLSYASSLFFGENFYAGAIISNDFIYSRIVDDTVITYHSFGTGQYRNYTDITTIGGDSIYIVYGNVSALAFMMNSSTDGGATWVTDTIHQGLSVYTSHVEVTGDSLTVLIQDGATSRLILARRHIAGGEWRKEVISRAQNQGYSLDAYVMAGTNGTEYHTAFSDQLSGELLFASSTGTGGISFSTQTLDSAGGNVSVVALDHRSNGNPVITYAGGDSSQLRLAHHNGSAWTYETVDSITQVRFVDMKISLADTVHIAYYSGADTCLKYAKRHILGSTWAYTDIDCDTIKTGEWPSITLDPAGNPHIAYQASYNRSLYHAYLGPAGWITDSLHGGSASHIGKHASILTDAAGLPKIAYLDEQSSAIWLAEKDAQGNWTKAIVESAPITNLGRPIDMQLDPYGKVWIAYNYFSNVDKVKIMHRDTSWREVAVSSTGEIANAFAFRIDGTNLNIFGRKNALQNTGMAMLHASNGVHVFQADPRMPAQAIRVSTYPNPFGASTRLQLELEQSNDLEISIHDLCGRQVATLLGSRRLAPGTHTFDWDASTFPDGMYIWQVRSSTGTLAGRVMKAQ